LEVILEVFASQEWEKFFSELEKNSFGSISLAIIILGGIGA